MPKAKNIWADPNREGRMKDRHSRRFCSKCGNTVQRVRILKSLNLCEFCVKEFEIKRDGITSCRGCGKVAPVELQEHNGYCSQCVCPACGKPDPDEVRKTGLCRKCASLIGDFCRKCGKEAAAQVRKNKGLCDECLKTRSPKSPAKPFISAEKPFRKQVTRRKPAQPRSLKSGSIGRTGTAVKNNSETPEGKSMKRRMVSAGSKFKLAHRPNNKSNKQSRL